MPFDIIIATIFYGQKGFSFYSVSVEQVWSRFTEAHYYSGSCSHELVSKLESLLSKFGLSVCKKLSCSIASLVLLSYCECSNSQGSCFNRLYWKLSYLYFNELLSLQKYEANFWTCSLCIGYGDMPNGYGYSCALCKFCDDMPSGHFEIEEIIWLSDSAVGIHVFHLSRK